MINQKKKLLLTIHEQSIKQNQVKKDKENLWHRTEYGKTMTR